MSDQSVPDYAHVVVVPIANPKTAPELIRLAEAFVRRDGGRVITLAVTLSDSDAEVNRDRLDELEAIAESFQPKPETKAEPIGDNGGEGTEVEAVLLGDTKMSPKVSVEFVTRTANNIARGILDQARESGAELILIGVQRPVRGEVNVGVIAQSVISAAPCDVLLYRVSKSPDFNRIVVPVDGSASARMAVRAGIMFANAFAGCPVEAMHVQSVDIPETVGRSRISESIEGLPGHGVVARKLIRGESVAGAVLSRTGEDHLIIMGFERRGELQEWLEGASPSREILDRAPGPVLLAVRSTEVTSAQSRIRRRVMGWVRPTLTDVEQEQIVWTANTNATLTLDYVVLMIVSATLASLGLLLNSAAVIIGAMLVAPLMSPLNAFAIGLSTANLGVMRRSFGTVVMGFFIASAVSYGIGFLVPTTTATSEMMSRVSPTLLDAFVALASGVVGSYATARRDIPAALAGVAIAAALVPPICTFGLQAAFGNSGLGLGAALLFLTNIVSIVVIATVVFVWLGLYPRELDRGRLSQYIPVAVLVAFSLPMVVALLNTVQRAQAENQVETVVVDVFEGLTVEAVLFEGEEPLDVVTRLQSPYTISPEAVALAERRVEAQLEQEVALSVVVLRVVRGAEPLDVALPERSPFVVREGVLQPREEEMEPTEQAIATPTAEPTVTPADD